MAFPKKYKSAKWTSGVVGIEGKLFHSSNLTKNFLVIKSLYIGICSADVK